MIPITGHTQLTALLGSPVAHSISPLMHNEAFHLLDPVSYTHLLNAVRNPGMHAFRFRLFRVRSPLLAESSFLSFPPGT